MKVKSLEAFTNQEHGFSNAEFKNILKLLNKGFSSRKHNPAAVRLTDKGSSLQHAIYSWQKEPLHRYVAQLDYDVPAELKPGFVSNEHSYLREFSEMPFEFQYVGITPDGLDEFSIPWRYSESKHIWSLDKGESNLAPRYYVDIKILGNIDVKEDPRGLDKLKELTEMADYVALPKKLDDGKYVTQAQGGIHDGEYPVLIVSKEFEGEFTIESEALANDFYNNILKFTHRHGITTDFRVGDGRRFEDFILEDFDLVYNIRSSTLAENTYYGPQSQIEQWLPIGESGIPDFNPSKVRQQEFMRLRYGNPITHIE